MRCLVAIDDVHVRDNVAHAAIAFGGVEVDSVPFDECRRQLKRRRYDFGVVDLRFGSKDSMDFWEKIRAQSPDLPLIGLTTAGGVAGHKSDRSRLQLFALLGVPVDVVELYRTLRRVIDRVKPDSSTRTRVVSMR